MDVAVIRRLTGSIAVPARWVVAAVTFVGFAFNLGLRITMNIAIVAMVNFTAVPQQRKPSPSSTSASGAVGNNATAEVDRCVSENARGPSTLSSLLSNSSISPPEGVGNTTSTASTNIKSGEGTFVWDETAQAAILGSFYWGYIFTQLLGGRLAEMFGPKFVLLGSLVSAAVVTMLIPTVAHWGFGWVIAIRILQGLCEGPTYPILNLIVARWAVADERSRMVTVLYVGGTIGTMITLAVGGLVIPTLGYASIFYMTGIGCLIWAVAFWFLAFDSPGQHPRISEKELSLFSAETAHGKKVTNVPWLKILTTPGVWAVVLSSMTKGWGIAVMQMMPIYLKAVLGFNVKSSGAFTALTSVGRLIFPLLFGWGVDWILKKKLVSRTNARKLSSSVDFFGNCLSFLVVSLVGCDYVLVVLCLTLASTFGGGAYPGYNSCVMEMSPNFSGTIGGFSAMGFSVGSLVSPLVAGAILQGRQNLKQWAVVYQLAAGVNLVMGILFWFIGTAERQLFDPPVLEGADENRNKGAEKPNGALELGAPSSESTADETPNKRADGPSSTGYSNESYEPDRTETDAPNSPENK